MVRREHRVVAALEAGEVGVERIGVLHEELARPQQTEARAEFVAVFPVDLVQIDGKVPVARVLPRHQRGDNLLGRRGQRVPVLLAVLDPEHHRAVHLVTAGLLPEIQRLGDRQAHFLRAGLVHFVAHNLGDVAQDASTEREPGVDPRRHPPDQTGPNHQLVARHLGIGRVVTQRAEEQGGHAHDRGGYWRLTRFSDDRR